MIQITNIMCSPDIMQNGVSCWKVSIRSIEWQKSDRLSTKPISTNSAAGKMICCAFKCSVIIIFIITYLLLQWSDLHLLNRVWETSAYITTWKYSVWVPYVHGSYRQKANIFIWLAPLQLHFVLVIIYTLLKTSFELSEMIFNEGIRR